MSSKTTIRSAVLSTLAATAALAFTASAASAVPAAGARSGLAPGPAVGGLIHRVLAVGTCGGKTCYVRAGKGVFGSISVHCRPNPPCPTNCPKSGCSAR